MSMKDLALLPSATLHLRDANDDLMILDGDKPVKVTLYGVSSKQYKEAMRKKQRALADLYDSKKGKFPELERLEASHVEFLCDVIESTENWEYDGLTGRDLQKAVLTDPGLDFIQEQINAFVTERTNFLKPASVK